MHQQRTAWTRLTGRNYPAGSLIPKFLLAKEENSEKVQRKQKHNDNKESVCKLHLKDFQKSKAKVANLMRKRNNEEQVFPK